MVVKRRNRQQLGDRQGRVKSAGRTLFNRENNLSSSGAKLPTRTSSGRPVLSRAQRQARLRSRTSKRGSQRGIGSGMFKF